MCGFVFVLNQNNGNVDKSLIEVMNQKIIHRGPDQEGYHFANNIGMGFRRLSILDLSEAGRQPMHSFDNRYTITFNGEIYNYIELKDELLALGYSFRSNSDTEVLLNSYLEWGESCLDRLNGMWAFLIYDNIEKTIFGARDRFGVKPLFVAQTGGHLLLASEIKCIRDCSIYKPETNLNAVAKFFIDGRLNDSQETFFSGITEIAPGTKLKIDNLGNITTNKYWSIDENKPQISDPDFDTKYFSIFEDAVKLRLRADVPVGVFLSGGLDSTAIICSMARNWPEHAKGDKLLHAFSFIDKEFDESVYINDTIAQTNATLHTFNSSANELYDLLDEALWFHDEPLHSMTALVGFSLMRLAKENGIKVVLNGQGADEVIAGYPTYRDNYWYTLLKDLKIKKWLSEINVYSKFHNLNRSTLLKQSALKTVSTQISQNKLARQFRSKKTPHNQIDLHPWLSKDLYNNLIPAHASDDQTLQGALKQSVYTAPLPLYMRIEDRNSMGNSIEARLPFMDYRLVQYSFSLEDSLKAHGPWNKYVLREAMKEKIPESTRIRVDKMGFPTPTKRWLTGPLLQTAKDIIHSKGFRERGIYNSKRVIADLDNLENSATNNVPLLFDILQFEHWSTKYSTKV